MEAGGAGGGSNGVFFDLRLSSIMHYSLLTYSHVVFQLILAAVGPLNYRSVAP